MPGPFMWRRRRKSKKPLQRFPFKDEIQTRNFMDPEKRDNIQAKSGTYFHFQIGDN